MCLVATCVFSYSPVSHAYKIVYVCSEVKTYVDIHVERCVFYRDAEVQSCVS